MVAGGRMAVGGLVLAVFLAGCAVPTGRAWANPAQQLVLLRGKCHRSPLLSLPNLCARSVGDSPQFEGDGPMLTEGKTLLNGSLRALLIPAREDLVVLAAQIGFPKKWTSIAAMTPSKRDASQGELLDHAWT